MASKILDLESLLRIPTVDSDLGYDISAQGNKIAFSWNRTGRWEIYIVVLEDNWGKGKVGQPFRITASQGSKFSPRWRPLHNQLSYILDVDGSENYDIYLFDFDTNQHTNLTPDTAYAISPAYSWSPDGTSIAFCADLNGQFDTYILSLSDGHLQQVTNRPHVDCEVTWSPDGNHLAIVTEAVGQDHWITIAPLFADPAIVISQDGEPVNARDPSWSPGGEHLLFSANNGNYNQVAIYHIKTKLFTWLTSGKGDKFHPTCALDGKYAYGISNGASSELAIHSLEKTEIITCQIAPG